MRLIGFFGRRHGERRLAVLAAAIAIPGVAAAQPSSVTRVVRADVVALDQLLIYNRFGSFNPFGMIFALRRDVSEMQSDGVRPERPDADLCGAQFGTEAGKGGLLAGQVRLRDCKRPRPLVLRVNAGDILELHIQNLLRPDQPGISGAFAEKNPAGGGFCEEPRSGAAEAPVRADILHGFDTVLVPPFDSLTQCRHVAKEAETQPTGTPGADWPRTRGLSFVIPGLEPIPIEEGKTIEPACTGMGAIAPGATVICRWRTDREGTHLFSSLAAPAGGEGEGGSLTHGLFGALIVEPKGSRYFRSQVGSKAFDRAWATKAETPPFVRAETIDFTASVDDDADAGRRGCQTGAAKVPVLEMTRPCPGGNKVEIVHGDLNAVIVPGQDGALPDLANADERQRREWREAHEARQAFREFTVVFHDELKTFYADAYKQLDRFGQLSGIRDGFAINYGASGVGSAVLANRLGIGPAANCPECLYEEFFLESWANGDPALLEAFPDDPSNVHHSYLNDKVVFRNFHAGKETHVFHLHSHQWFAGNDAGRGAYLDSQTIGPQQGFTYRIYHGGLERFASDRTGSEPPKGWWDSLGTGNRNRTPGDAIFHCHLYPHFAQGMWALWRVHDVLEDGRRLLPDGQRLPGLSVAPNHLKTLSRSGSVGPAGEWLAPGPGGRRNQGTPVPGIVPLPGHGLPPLPTYTDPVVAATLAPGQDLQTEAMPGYPFYIAGKPGHRSPQPPLDMATADIDPSGGIEQRHIQALGGRRYLDGGLPRHVVTGGSAVPSVLADIPAALREKTIEKGGVLARMLARGDMTSEFEHIGIELLPQAGTVLERNAMKFHSHGSGVAVMAATASVLLDQTTIDKPADVFPASEPNDAKTRLDPKVGAYKVPRFPRDQLSGPTSLQSDGWFAVNGANGAPGAPFADPCGAPLLFGQGDPRQTHRRFDAHLGEWQTKAGEFTKIDDPLRPSTPLVPDPGLLGFRRFHVSAVPLTLVVNRAGWHDPQGRINILSAEAHTYKGKVRSDAEPFYFRAFSGECIEIRHTNETPKDLELDDFQMKVPTDTIGQHIHLVKFDVTSSDGSGNGFNYEDGTFAPDEVYDRICKSKGSVTRRSGEAASRFEEVADRTDECADTGFKAKLRRMQRLESTNIKYFQTTVQRWFADPILSDTGDEGRKGVGDRTMRTVFTHDHFGPSNIQQHGFYSALLIEPASHAVCAMAEPRSSMGDGKACVLGPAAKAHPSFPRLALDPPRHLVGARADVLDYKRDEIRDGSSGDPMHIDAREYAIAIADFALLYDGRRGERGPTVSGGIDQLVREAQDPTVRHREDEEGESAPNRFLSDHGIALNADENSKLLRHRTRLREAHGRPVAPPPRPEAISQKHHDPYLINYRNEPVPLRIGTTSGAAKPSFLSNPCRSAGIMAALPGASESAESIARQRRMENGGDLSDLFKSQIHGDPCTPILEGLSGDRIVARIIQGAQEVQHTFVVEGRTGRRNVDQPFPTERPKGPEGAAAATRAAACATHPVAKWGRPREYPGWASFGSNDPRFEASDVAAWERFDRVIAGCDNVLGYVSAQEIGISEHFEVGSQFSAAGAYTIPKFRPKTDPVAGPLPILPADRALDYLYHFGSTDALWNGAWGLVRLYERVDVPDLSACMWQPNEPQSCSAGVPPIGDRLIPLRERRRALNGKTDLEPAAGALAMLTMSATPAAATKPVTPARTVPNQELSCALPGQPKVEAHIVAARMAELVADGPDGRSGLRYGSALFDPDGSLFVAVDKAPSSRADAILRAKAALLQKPMADPLVIRIRAGDCLSLSFFNALPSQSKACTGRGAGDRIGDAPMPKIVPLNVDCDERQFGESETFADWSSKKSGTSRPDIRPSSRVALSIPLPAPRGKPAGIFPVGMNEAPPIEPGTPGQATDYYAGFFWLDGEKLTEMAKAAFKVVTAPPHAMGDLQRRSVVPLAERDCKMEEQVVVLGRHFCMVEDPDALEIRADTAKHIRSGRDAAQGELTKFFTDPMNYNQVVRRIPYAFGALPIRSLGDVISHGAHGLVGTLVVEPAGTEAEGGGVPSRHATALALKLPELAFPEAKLPTIPDRLVKEQVLVWQDGLNLRAQLSPKVTDLGIDGRPLPECAVCDDSYDLGEKGVSYRSEPFFHRLAMGGAVVRDFGLRHYPRNEDDLNTALFPPDFFAARPATPTIEATTSRELAIRITHPGGRARQRAFVPLFPGYDDLFPGFGSGHSTLLGPGKAMTAWAQAPETSGCYLWRDGPQPIFAAGAWGQLSVHQGCPPLKAPVAAAAPPTIKAR